MRYFFLLFFFRLSVFLLLIWLFRRSLRARKGSHFRNLRQYFSPSILALLLLFYSFFQATPVFLDTLDWMHGNYRAEQLRFVREGMFRYRYVSEDGRTFILPGVTIDPRETYSLQYLPRTRYVIHLYDSEAETEHPKQGRK